MRPALIVGVVGRTRIPSSARNALAAKLRLILRFLRYGASAGDPEHSGSTLGARLGAELGDPSLSSPIASWQGLEEAELVLLTSPDPDAEALPVQVLEELRQADPLSRMSWRPAPRLALDSQVLIAICEDASAPMPSEAARLAQSWLAGAALATSGEALALGGSRGPLFHLPLREERGEEPALAGPIRLLLDALDWPRSAATAEPLPAPTAQALRDLREQNLSRHLGALRELDEFLEFERYEARVAPKEAQAHFEQLLDRTTTEAHDLEAELRRAGGTQLVVDLREIARLHARAQRASEALAPRLEQRTLLLAAIAVIGLLCFGHRELGAAARLAAFCVGGLASLGALALFHLQTRSARRQRSRAYRGAAEDARVHFAWAACGIDRDGAASVEPSRIVGAVRLALPRTAAAVAALPASTRLRLVRAQLHAWIGAEERAWQRRAAEQQRCAERCAELVRIASLTGSTIVVATGACLFSGRAELHPATPLVVLSFALFGSALGPRAADLGWRVRSWMVGLRAQLQAALPLAAILLWLASACSQSGTPHERHADAFELALLFASLLIVPALLSIAFLDRLLGRESARSRGSAELALRRARLALEDLIARGERAALTGASAELAAAEAAIREILRAAGKETLEAQRA